MATMLGITRDTYAKYERRSLLRHDLIPAVAKITGHDVWYILTGQPRQEAGIKAMEEEHKGIDKKRERGDSWPTVRGGRS